MNIIWITTKHPPKSGGLAQSSGRLVNSLRDRGHSVTVLNLSKNARQISPLEYGLVIVPDKKAQAEPERLFWLYKSLMAGADVIIGFGGNQAGYYASLWAKWLDRISMVLFRGNDFDKLVHDTKQSWLTHFILKHADIMAAVSTEMVSRISTMTERPVIYSPNSIDAREWGFLKSDVEFKGKWRLKNCPEGKSESKPDGKSVIGMFGHLKSKKGLDTAFELFDDKSSFRFCRRAYLLTVGAVPEKYSKDRSAYKESDFWMHNPFQKRELLPQYYGVCDIVFIPSLYDGMPNVLLESMLLGRVVVGSKAGALPDVIEHGKNGFLFNIGDTKNAAETLDFVLKLDSKQMEKIGKAAKETIEKRFTPENEVKIIEDAICQC